MNTRGEAGAGIERANGGFADLGLTTWLPRRTNSIVSRSRAVATPQQFIGDCIANGFLDGIAHRARTEPG